jgi:hypothetical protein
MNSANKQGILIDLANEYLEWRRYPFTELWCAFYNWLKRSNGDKNAFSIIRDHDLTQSLEAHEKIASFIEKNDIKIYELKDFIVYLRIHNKRLSYKGIFIIGATSLFTGLIGFFKFGFGEPTNILLSIVGVFSIGMLLERIYLHKYITLYEELIDLIEREISKTL